jgi:hypothetical protein
VIDISQLILVLIEIIGLIEVAKLVVEKTETFLKKVIKLTKCFGQFIKAIKSALVEGFSA